MNDIRYTELIKACGLYGNDHLGDMLELCYQVAADERELCAQVCEDHFSSDGDWCAKQIRARSENNG